MNEFEDDDDDAASEWYEVVALDGVMGDAGMFAVDNCPLEVAYELDEPLVPLVDACGGGCNVCIPPLLCCEYAVCVCPFVMTGEALLFAAALTASSCDEAHA